jgi:general secretion pathway protein K
MRILLQPQRRRGIALLAVMIAIFVLAILAGAFAYSMKVETKLARNAHNETELIWLGRSGVELARYVVAQQLNCAMEPYDSLNQLWAGGPGGACATNGPLEGITLRDFHLGNGVFSVTITDLERKVNINIANEDVLQQAMTLVGVDPDQSATVVASILDWIDPDDDPHINGTESDYYESLDPPYVAKNKPIDDISELLLVRGVTPEMYWGSGSTNYSMATFQARLDHFGRPVEAPFYAVGLVDLFTPIGVGRININTASFTQLQMIPLVDEIVASEIIRMRSGPDGVDGTEDDTPFHNPGELVNVGLGRNVVQQLMRFCDVRSRTFEVQVDAEVGGYRRQFFAILGRNNQRDVQILSFYWK